MSKLNYAGYNPLTEKLVQPIGTPTADKEVANKKYVDDAIAGGYDQSLNTSDSVSFVDLTLTGNLNYSAEVLTLTGGAFSVDLNKSVTFIELVSGTNTATLGSGTTVGQIKMILMKSFTAGTMAITFDSTPAGNEPEINFATDDTGHITLIWNGVNWSTIEFTNI